MDIKHIGMVGLGREARCIMHRLQLDGFDVTAYDDDPQRVAAAVALGAHPAAIPADAAEPADAVVVTMPDEVSAYEALFDLGGIGETLREGGYVLDASAVNPDFGRVANARLAAFGIVRVELLLDGWLTSSPRRLAVRAASHEIAAVAPLLAMLADEVVNLGPARRARQVSSSAPRTCASGVLRSVPELTAARP